MLRCLQVDLSKQLPERCSESSCLFSSYNMIMSTKPGLSRVPGRGLGQSFEISRVRKPLACKEVVSHGTMNDDEPKLG